MTRKEIVARKALRDNLISPLVLAAARHFGEQVLDTNAWNVHISCVSLREQEGGTDRPLGYWSRSRYVA